MSIAWSVKTYRCGPWPGGGQGPPYAARPNARPLRGIRPRQRRWDVVPVAREQPRNRLAVLKRGTREGERHIVSQCPAIVRDNGSRRGARAAFVSVLRSEAQVPPEQVWKA
jgi:hypothetical protein